MARYSVNISMTHLIYSSYPQTSVTGVSKSHDSIVTHMLTWDISMVTHVCVKQPISCLQGKDSSIHGTTRNMVQYTLQLRRWTEWYACDRMVCMWWLYEYDLSLIQLQV